MHSDGWLAPITAFAAFVAGRMIYGGFGSAAPPAIQAIVVARTSRAERTRALTLLGSAFGLGTILGPAIAPYLVVGRIGQGGPEVGLTGPALIFSLISLAMLVVVARYLPRDVDSADSHGAVFSYPYLAAAAALALIVLYGWFSLRSSPPAPEAFPER